MRSRVMSRPGSFFYADILPRSNMSEIGASIARAMVGGG
jgi:hypothetical protein